MSDNSKIKTVIFERKHFKTIVSKYNWKFNIDLEKKYHQSLLMKFKKDLCQNIILIQIIFRKYLASTLTTVNYYQVTPDGTTMR